MINHANHISNHLGKLILKWKEANPIAIKAIKKVHDDNNGFFFLDSKDKQKMIEEYRMKNFKLSNGQRIDLSKYK